MEIKDQPNRNLIPLWDYGWCTHERIQIPACRLPTELIHAYFNSKEFGTSFVGRNAPHTPEIHGPFPTSKVSEADFELLSVTQFLEAIATIPQTSGFDEPPSREAWGRVQKLVSEISSHQTWLFKFRMTEDNQDSFHDFGFVLTIFREFIGASPNQDYLERLVFGYD